MIRLVIKVLFILSCVASTQAASDRYDPNDRTPNNNIQFKPNSLPVSDPDAQNTSGSAPPSSAKPSHSDKCNEAAIAAGICSAAQPSRNHQSLPHPSVPDKLNPAVSTNRLPFQINHTTPSLNGAYEPGQILLYFKNAHTVHLRIQQIEQKLQLKPEKHIKLEALSGEIIQYQTNLDLKRLKQQLNQIAPEAIIDLNVYYFSQAGPRQYFASEIRLNNISKVSKIHIPVGIIDTDVTQVPALQSSTLKHRNFLPAHSQPASSEHGTGVALLIAGHDDNYQFYGVAAGAPLFIASIMRKSAIKNHTNTLLLAQAIDWLIAEKVQIINLSLGGPGDAIMQTLFNSLQDLPTLLIAAAGNNGSNAPPSYPAAYPKVIAVTATNANRQIYKHANQGAYIDIAAPGVDVWVPLNKQGVYMNGTSFSAALVTGAICRLMSNAEIADSAHIKEKLFQQTLDLGKSGKDIIYGRGLLQLN